MVQLGIGDRARDRVVVNRPVVLEIETTPSRRNVVSSVRFIGWTGCCKPVYTLVLHEMDSRLLV